MIKKGDIVRVHFIGTLDDGKVFESTQGKEPLEFEVGSGDVYSFFDTCVIGMKEGEMREFRIEPSDAFGFHRKELIQKVPRQKLQGDFKQGEWIDMKVSSGEQRKAKVLDITDDEITLDFNHPLAGKALNLQIKIISVNQASQQQKPNQ